MSKLKILLRFFRFLFLGCRIMIRFLFLEGRIRIRYFLEDRIRGQLQLLRSYGQFVHVSISPCISRYIIGSREREEGACTGGADPNFGGIWIRIFKNDRIRLRSRFKICLRFFRPSALAPARASARPRPGALPLACGL